MIRVTRIDTIPIMQPGGEMKDEQFATLTFSHKGQQHGAVRVYLSDLLDQAGSVSVGDELKVVKAEALPEQLPDPQP
jgi:hypothetical protein